MFHNHHRADASITVTGVSLGCVNPDTKNWEVAFIKDSAHLLMMEVTEHTNGEKRIIRPNAEIPVGSTITIEATNGAVRAPTFFTGEADCPESFNLILDLEEDVYDDTVDFKRPDEYVIPLFVPGAMLYSLSNKLSKFPMRLISKGDKKLTAVKTFGHIGTSVGADIRCGEGGDVVIKVEGEAGFELRLPSSPDIRYEIAFDNNCPAPPVIAAGAPPAAGGFVAPPAAGGFVAPPAAGGFVAPPALNVSPAGSDFVLYYAMLTPPAGKGEFDLVSDDDDRGDGVVCNYSHLGRTSRIFPLPT